ncbi:MAG TPA: peptide ABC transporter substrate-binding protein [Gemmatimonadaceae bacterium]|nr:peptide ABC transporter substrate-binding protein [Gemmatimonadaceae bacterium]
MKPWLLPLFVGAVACGDQRTRADGVDAGGTLVIASTADPGTLFPPLVVSTQGKQISEQIYDYLADVGPEMNTRGDKGFRGQLADSWTWARDSMSIAFHVNPRARWHDGVRADANDVAFTFALNKDPGLAGRMETELTNIDSVSVPDSSTAIFWFHARSPTQFLDAAAQLPILPAHLLKSVTPQSLHDAPPSPVGTGRFRLKSWNHGTSLELVADSSNYRGRAKLDRVIWSVTSAAPAAVAKLFGGEVDLFDGVRLENMADLTKHRNVRVLILPGTDYVFLLFNLRDPVQHSKPHQLFGDRNLRRALAMSIDRAALVTNVFDTLASVSLGPTVRAFDFTSPMIPQIPFDTASGRAMLDSLGWAHLDKDGIRTRNGRALGFSLLVQSNSINRIRMATMIQAQLKKMGVDVQIEIMDPAAQGARLTTHTFDASISTWRLGASPDGTRGAWTRAGLEKSGVNYGSYENAQFDAQLELALSADPANSRTVFTKAFAIINQDAPAVWLYEPKTVLGIHKRVRTPRMRPDAWWIGLGDWFIPPTERILRDRIPASR